MIVEQGVRSVGGDEDIDKHSRVLRQYNTIIKGSTLQENE